MAFPFAPSNLSNTGAASAITLTIPATAGQYSYVTALTVTGLGATAASGVTATLSGLAAGNMSFVIPVPAGITVGITPLVVPFPEPLQSTAVNTAIVLTVPSFGTGNTLSAATLHGYNEP